MQASRNGDECDRHRQYIMQPQQHTRDQMQNTHEILIYETNTWTNMQDKYALLRYVETQLGRARQTTHAKMRHE